MGFGRAESGEELLRVGEAVVVGVVGRAVAPGEFVGARGGGNGGVAMALVALDPGEDIPRVRVPERIRPAFGGRPDLLEQFACGAVLPTLTVELGQRGQRGEFFFDVIDGPGAGEGVVETILGSIEVAETQCRRTVQARSEYEVGINAFKARQVPGSLGARLPGVNAQERPESTLRPPSDIIKHGVLRIHQAAS